jgi:FMN phosphatase YigB (HAD superfamily)
VLPHARVLPTPRALLLDFGGVIADGPEPPDWLPRVVSVVREVVAAAGAPPPPVAAVAAALTDGRGEFSGPTQPDHASFWAAVAAGWPPAARAAVVPHAATLSRRFMEIRHASSWQLRPGMAELLADAHRHGLPLAVVSNTLCGAPHRQFLSRIGVADRFVVQLYSDEQGLRKPNPQFALRAVAAVRAEPAGCWFVGDTRSRDMLVARRAGLGAAILMRSLRVEHPPHPAGSEPDVELADPPALHALLAAHW